MYIFKNALKCIGRSKGRNALIGVIVFIIALSACLGLSIRQAAESSREETLKNLKITANISFDRSSMSTPNPGIPVDTTACCIAWKALIRLFLQQHSLGSLNG